MSKEELLKYLIAEIDLIMHDKDYRFENANGTWYSRESCRDLTNEEVFEELRTELRQFADLEAKLAESEKKNFELVAKIKLKEHTPAFCILADRDCEALGKIAELQKQLAEKDKAIENWQTIYESVVQTCHNDKEEIERLNKKLAEKDKEIQRTHNYYQAVRNRETIRESKISFAVDILEELAGCSNYINSKLDFECGSYVSEKAIRDKIKYLKGKKDE